ncbi:MAG: hypothetical protein EOP85_19040, partial [Verrucomicrobiaceae bacterium]
TGGGTTIAETFDLIADAFGRAGIRHEGGSQTLTLTGPINIADQGDLVITDDARVRIGAAGKTYQGFRTNIAFGHLRTLVSNALPPDQPVLMAQDTGANAKWFLGEGTAITQTIGGLSSTAVSPNSGIVGTASSDSTLTINQDLNTTFGLPVGGTGTNENKVAIVKSGKGRLTLSSINTYTGPTTVNGGTLLFNANNLGTSVTVQPGGTLGGVGRVRDFTATGNVSASASISPGGNGVGTFSTTNSAIFGPYSAYNWQIQDWTGGPGNADRVTAISSNFNISATSATPVTIRISQIGNVANFTDTPKSFVIGSGGFGVVGFAANKFVIDSSGFTAGTGTWSIRQDGTTVVLDYAPVAGGGSYATWATANGIPGEPASGDFDKDGLLNLLEYALGLNPTVPNGTPGSFSGGVV